MNVDGQPRATSPNLGSSTALLKMPRKTPPHVDQDCATLTLAYSGVMFLTIPRRTHDLHTHSDSDRCASRDIPTTAFYRHFKALSSVTCEMVGMAKNPAPTCCDEDADGTSENKITTAIPPI